jgi:hypothetical protein
MANNFSTVKNNQASEKVELIRIVPRRWINDDLTLISGTRYNTTWAYPIQKVMANDTELTLTSTASSSDEYAYDETTGELIVNSVPSSTNQIVVYYYVFYTSGQVRVITEDPENTATSLRDWEPLVITSPSVSQSQENIIEGFFSISASNLVLSNAENQIQNYLTANDSWNKAEVEIWLTLDNVENIQKIFKGKVVSVSISENRANINIDDDFSNVLNPAFMGDIDREDNYYSRDATFPNLDLQKVSTPIPFFFGSASRYLLLNENISTLTTASKLDPLSLYEAVNANVSGTVSTTTNRTYLTGRIDSNGALSFAFTPSNVDQSDPNFTRLDGTASEIAKFKIGDTFDLTQAGTHYARVLYVDTSNNYLYITKTGAISTGVVVNSNNLPSIVINDSIGNVYYLLYGRDYSVTPITSSGGNKLLRIDLVNNFEASFGLSALDPAVHKVKYRIRPDTTDHKHGSVIKRLLEDAGLTVNTTSITTANTAFDGLCNFSIPNFDEIDFDTYQKYIQDILASTFGLVKLNNNFEVEYQLFSAPSSSNELTNVDILDDSWRVGIEYRDIIDTIIAYNPHYSSTEAKADVNNSPSVTEEDFKSRYLHNINKKIRFRHVLEKINSRISELIKVKANRRALYELDSKIINIDNEIGDDLLLNREGLLGGDSTKQLKILSIDKSTEKTTMILSDLLNL